jgi:hypothetical protein
MKTTMQPAPAPSNHALAPTGVPRVTGALGTRCALGVIRTLGALIILPLLTTAAETYTNMVVTGSNATASGTVLTSGTGQIWTGNAGDVYTSSTGVALAVNLGGNAVLTDAHIRQVSPAALSALSVYVNQQGRLTMNGGSITKIQSPGNPAGGPVMVDSWNTPGGAEMRLNNVNINFELGDPSGYQYAVEARADSLLYMNGGFSVPMLLLENLKSMFFNRVKISASAPF